MSEPGMDLVDGQHVMLGLLADQVHGQHERLRRSGQREEGLLQYLQR
ncbi:hypothetical protein [Streptomyces sp. NPDC058773]